MFKSYSDQHFKTLDLATYKNTIAYYIRMLVLTSFSFMRVVNENFMS